MRNFYDPEDKYSWITGMIIAVILSMAIAATITIVWCLQHNEPKKAPNQERSQKLAEMPRVRLKTNVPQLPEAKPKMVKIQTADGVIEEPWIDL